MYDAMLAETIAVTGDGGDPIEAYLARPLAAGPFGGVVVLHHFPGYDEQTREITRRLAVSGYLAVCPNLYSREAPGAEPAAAAAAVVGKGGVPDAQTVGDIAGAAAHLRALANSNGRVGVLGFSYGGRQAFLAACSMRLDAAVTCYGGAIVRPAPPTLPLDLKPIAGAAGSLGCPLLGLFGAADEHPAPDETAELGRELAALGKTYEFHTYEGVGHSFLAVDRPGYQPEAAADAWQRILGWLGRHLE